nr:MAG TPA: hypothetical protein [Caudoviricetes sp.]
MFKDCIEFDGERLFGVPVYELTLKKIVRKLAEKEIGDFGPWQEAEWAINRNLAGKTVRIKKTGQKARLACVNFLLPDLIMAESAGEEPNMNCVLMDMDGRVLMEKPKNVTFMQVKED